jgi:AcrR family transcriptional regulator
MATLTREIILATANDVVEEIGIEKARVSDVSKRLGTTHAAIYKYFKNKDELFEELTKQWLLTTEAPILNFTTDTPGPAAVHEWLTLLITTKHTNFLQDPKMFKLYTTNVQKSDAMSNWLLDRLWAKAEYALGVESEGHKTGQAIMTAFTAFEHPNMSFGWNRPTLNAEFEQVWAIIEPGLEKLVE